MMPEEVRPIFQWCLETALETLGPTVERFVRTNQDEFTKVKDHQWHALLAEAVAASGVQDIQQFLHYQGTRSTRREWREPVRLTFAHQDQYEILWLALVRLLNWIRNEGSLPQQRISELQRDLGDVCFDAGTGVPVALDPGTVELALAQAVIRRLVAKVEEVRRA
jgi:hypothetical protein